VLPTGANLLTRRSTPEASVRGDPRSLLEEKLARLRGEGPVRLWVRLQEPDTVDNGRRRYRLYLALRFTTGFGGQPSTFMAGFDAARPFQTSSSMT
jgi:hypothetical protein